MLGEHAQDWEFSEQSNTDARPLLGKNSVRPWTYNRRDGVYLLSEQTQGLVYLLSEQSLVRGQLLFIICASLSSMFPQKTLRVHTASYYDIRVGTTGGGSPTPLHHYLCPGATQVRPWDGNGKKTVRDVKCSLGPSVTFSIDLDNPFIS